MLSNIGQGWAFLMLHFHRQRCPFKATLGGNSDKCTWGRFPSSQSVMDWGGLSRSDPVSHDFGGGHKPASGCALPISIFNFLIRIFSSTRNWTFNMSIYIYYYSILFVIVNRACGFPQYFPFQCTYHLKCFTEPLSQFVRSCSTKCCTFSWENEACSPKDVYSSLMTVTQPTKPRKSQFPQSC